MEKTAFITVGVSGSGKSTWAEEMVEQLTEQGERVVRLERDRARALIYAEKRDTTADQFNWQKWNWKWEGLVSNLIDERMKEAMDNGDHIIVSDTNLHVGRRNALIKKLADAGYEVVVKEFPIRYEEAVKRDSFRKNGVGPSVIAKQFEQWDAEHTNRYVPDESLPQAIVFDIDGTLAHMAGKRGPFEWDKVDVDDPDEMVIAMAKAYAAAGYVIVVLSGRDGSCRDLTEKWLVKHNVPFSELHMRAAADQRSDYIIKEELFDAHLRNRFNVKMMVDDRPQVCRMWRGLGLKVAQMGNPHVEF